MGYVARIPALGDVRLGLINKKPAQQDRLVRGVKGGIPHRNIIQLISSLWNAKHIKLDRVFRLFK